VTFFQYRQMIVEIVSKTPNLLKFAPKPMLNRNFFNVVRSLRSLKNAKLVEVCPEHLARCTAECKKNHIPITCMLNH